ncbi:hypothetical protein [Nonomuraea ceibae]|uniref:hypothetical protein n=1 Tax=Nonomuraea ceibae TaxID=1935170 RepID=UPI001FE6674B|nr:hypothetical protein [Nonomuraea ceibae]
MPAGFVILQGPVQRRPAHAELAGDGGDGLSTSLSFRELLALRGQYVLPVKPDGVPVSDGAGGRAQATA